MIQHDSEANSVLTMNRRRMNALNFSTYVDAENSDTRINHIHSNPEYYAISYYPIEEEFSAFITLLHVEFLLQLRLYRFDLFRYKIHFSFEI